MKARWRAPVSASYRAEGCSNASRHSRMIFKTVTALALRLVRLNRRAGTPPCIVTSTCQSEIKRTLRLANRCGRSPYLRGIFRDARRSFNADGEREVSKSDEIWFRNGSRLRVCVFFPANPPSIENLRQIESVGFFANFRRFNFNANTCDLSRAVTQARLRGQPQQSRNNDDDRDREMFFLLRMAFWLGLVLVLLPRDKTPESEKLPQVGASDAVSAATAAVSDMSQFCKRQPAACEVGGQAATVIGHRAQEGARKLYQIITDKRSDRTGSIHGVDGMAASGDTLTLDDLQADWRPVPPP